MVCRLRTILAVALWCVIAMALPAAANATTASGSVTMVSANGDYIAQGTDHLFDGTNSFTISGDPTYFSVTTPVAPGAISGYTLIFAPPNGSQLQVGSYDNAERFASATGGGIDVFGDGRGCNEDLGRFVVKDIHVDVSGNVDRFWAVYEQHCEQPGAPALFGEVRVGEPAASAPETVEPMAINWPSTPVGSAAQWVPVTVVAGGSGAHVASVALSGANVGDFSTQTDSCTGATLAAGARCQVWVNVSPLAGGDRTAQLVVTDTDTSTTSVALAMLPQPAVTSVSPDVGVPAGGTSVTIHGSGFTDATGVKFGSQPAASFTVDSTSQISATTPSESAGTVDVTVTGPHGTSWTTSADQFDFADPTTTSVTASPSSSVFGTPVTYNAIVSSTFGTPTGSVDFSAEGYDLGSTSLSGGHTTSGPTLALDVGATVTGAYGGDSTFGHSNGSLQTDIQPAQTSTSLRSSANPVAPGATVTITATVTNTAGTAITPFGSVQFTVNGSPILSPLPLDDNGQAGIVGHLPAGNYTIGAHYHDNTAAIPDFVDSDASLLQVVGSATATAPPPPPAATPSPTSAAPGSPYVPKNILLLVGTPTIKRGGKIVIPVHSVAGLVRAVATLAGARTVYGRNWRTTTGGTVKLVIAPNRHAKALLARRKKLNLQVTVRLLPASGAATQTAVLKTIVKARLRRR